LGSRRAAPRRGCRRCRTHARKCGAELRFRRRRPSCRAPPAVGDPVRTARGAACGQHGRASSGAAAVSSAAQPDPGRASDLVDRAIVQERLSARPVRLWGPATGRRPSGGDVAPLLLRAVQTLAALHALDWRQVLGDWEAPRSASDELAHWDRLLDKHPDPAWAQGGRELSGVDSGPHRIGFFHGDYHTNIILFDGDGSVAAVIDWEIAGIGRTGLDLGCLTLPTDPSSWHPNQRRRMRVVAEPGQLQGWYASASGLPMTHPDWIGRWPATAWALLRDSTCDSTAPVAARTPSTRTSLRPCRCSSNEDGNWSGFRKRPRPRCTVCAPGE